MADLDAEQTGAIGHREAAANFARIGWGPIDNFMHDRGTDLVLQVRDVRGVELPVFVGAQVKTGKSWFRAAKKDDDGKVVGWWFRDPDGEHIRAWLNHSVPFLIVLHSKKKRRSYWVHVTDAAVRPAGRGLKILVPKANIVRRRSRDALMKVAGAQRPVFTWEGSAWHAGADIESADLLRHALVAPRLVAPHPNSGIDRELTAEQAIAMLMQARLAGLDHYAREQPAVPELSSARAHPDWTWRFAAALHARVVEDDISPVLLAIADAPTPGARAAAAVASASALIESLRIDEALGLLDGAISAADRRSVDAAWLRVQRARALIQVGRYGDAQQDLLDAQSLRLLAPRDATATGIAGVAVKLLFQIAPWRDKDLESLITGGDTATSWWRTQTASAGLWEVVDRSFESWARDRSVTIAGGDGSSNELNAAALMATHVGDHGAWAVLSAVLAKDVLLQLDRSASRDVVVNALHLLRLAGDGRGIEHAVRRFVADGPAAAVTEGARDVDLETSTAGTARADLALLQHGGDVLDTATASRTVAWLLATLDDPGPFVERTRPTYAVTSQLAETLAASLPAARPDDQRAVATRLLALDGVEQVLAASSWAKVVVALPSAAWSDEDVPHVADVSDRHALPLRLAFLSAAADRGHKPSRQRLLEAAGRGELGALRALGDVRELPADLIDTQIAALAGAVKQITVDAHDGKHQFGGVDPAHDLVLLNLWHAEAAEWEPVLELLEDPIVNAGAKRGPLRLLGNMSDRVSPEVRGRLGPIAANIARGFGEPDLLTSQSIAGEGARLAVALDALSDEEAAHRLTRLIGGDRADRLMAATIAGRSSMPERLGILSALMGDAMPEVRARAAAGLSLALAAGQEGTLVVETLRAGLDDPGTRVGEAIAATLYNATSQTALEFRNSLRTSPSAYVRGLAPSG